MINAQKILGGLLRNRAGDKKIHMAAQQGTTGTGFLSDAMNSIKKFIKPAAGTSPTPPGTAPVHPEHETPPDDGRAASPPPPPRKAPGESADMDVMDRMDPDGLVLIQAMIASAAADGHIDASEKSRIMESVESIGLNAEERSFLEKELANPVDMEKLAAGAKTPEMAKEIYTVSLMAVKADTHSEQEYLKKLAQRLHIDSETVKKVHTGLGVENF